MKRCLVKVCGITTFEDADACIALGVDWLGINLVPESPRFVTGEAARLLAKHVGERARLVLVVANRSFEELRALREATGVDWLQLHGDEPPEVVEALSPGVFKAMRIGSEADVDRARAYPGELLLVDAKVSGKLGGTGKTVDFGLVAPLSRARKLVLAGGLTPENVAQAIDSVRPYAVDVASGVEQGGGSLRKDPLKVEAFVRAVEGAPRVAP